MPSSKNGSDKPDNPYRLNTASISWRQGDVPTADSFDDIYYSIQHGLEESRHVFLQHNLLSERWQQLKDNASFCIAETGFGTGLNFLAAWQCWQKEAPATAHLQFVSFEKFPLKRQDLQRALAPWAELTPLTKQLLEQYPLPVPGPHLLQFSNANVSLLLIFGDAIESLQQLDPNTSPVDAWFLDGFAPAKNPQLWNDQLYSLMAKFSRNGTTVATFTAVGAVRRGLTSAGFTMEKVAGFGNKREMLRGQLKQTVKQEWDTKPSWWSNLTPPLSMANRRHVAIIGGGLAGTSCAHAIAKRGWRVTLIERENTLASAASGNPQGMLFTKLSPEASTLSQFSLSSFLYALRYYRQWENQLDENQLSFCGVMQLAHSAKEQRLYQQLQTTFSHLPELVQFVDSQQASQISDLPLQHSGWFFPAAGWLSPPALCRAQVNHPAIAVELNQQALNLHYSEPCWTISKEGDRELLKADAVIIANSRDALQLTQTQQLPLRTIRGQITLLPTDDTLSGLNTVICHEGYLTPAIAGSHSLGATYDLDDSDTQLRPGDHSRNLQSLAKVLPEIQGKIDESAGLSGRAALRCTSPDYLPLAGPVAIYDDFLEQFAGLRKNAKRPIEHAGSYHPQLYVSLAHGSRGLTSTPLCAELIASQLNGEVSPTFQTLAQALNPARFIIRDLIRNKI